MSEVIKQNIYTEIEACVYLKICRTTLYFLRKKRKIAFSRAGGQIRYTQKHLDDYLESTEISPATRLFKKAS